MVTYFIINLLLFNVIKITIIPKSYTLTNDIFTNLKMNHIDVSKKGPYVKTSKLKSLEYSKRKNKVKLKCPSFKKLQCLLINAYATTHISKTEEKIMI